MTYLIKKTDGTDLVEIPDLDINQDATDLTLIGKNVIGYGEYINENFVRLLENFASTSEPPNAIVGQLWFDLTENRVKVYDGNGFAVASGPIVSPNAPLTPNQGDFWIDNKENQVFAYDGVDRILVGPIYRDSQGLSGFEIETIRDSSGNSRTVTLLWSNANLLGIWSHHPEFTPVGLTNFSSTIKPGFNVNPNIQNFKLHATATVAESLIDSLGNVRSADELFFNDESNTVSGTLTILNSEPLVLGVNQENTILTNLSNLQIRSNINNQDIIVTTRNGGNFVNAITVKGATNRIGIFNNNPSSTLDVNGNVIISGDLTVNGNTVTINSTELSIDDKTITLSATTTPTDTLADGGGIILAGTTDHTILWSNANSSWTSSENFNLSAGRAYRINNVNVLSETTLSSSVTSATGLTQIGTLVNLQVDTINVNGSSISSTAPFLGINGLLVTIADGEGRSAITNLQLTPTNDTNAASKFYVDNSVERPWTEVDETYTAENKDRLLVSTSSGQVVIGLPEVPQPGNYIRFVDYDGTFDSNNLIVSRYRRHVVSAPNGVAAATGTFQGFLGAGIPTTGGVGTGLTVHVTVSSVGTYTNFNTSITVVNQGENYQTGDLITVPGTLLGGVSPTNDLLFEITLMDNVLGLDQDLVIDRKNASFGLIYVNPNQGWVFTETFELPPTVNVDVVGNLTGNVLGNVTGNVLGNIEGDVTGDLTGTVLTASQPNITTVGTLSNLTVSGTITGNLLGDVTGNVTGQLFGNVTGNSVTSPTSLTLASTLSNIRLQSGTDGLRVSSFDDTGAQEQYNIEITPGSAPGNRSSTLLFGDVVVENISTTNINGASFRLPQYTTAQRDARVLTNLNYGDLIYNTTTNKVQAYTSTGWVDLH
jgi:hypothetical protein